MRITLALSALVVASAAIPAQNSILFTGRFPFKSLDQANERPGGSITAIEEFDFSFCTPGPGAFARSLQTATAHQAYYGDANADGNYLKLASPPLGNFKTYFGNINMGSLFVKAAEKPLVTPERVYFTVRSNQVGLQFEAFDVNGTVVNALRPGDFVRFTGNGNLEYFCTADQLDVAAGLPPAGQGTTKGASAMCQDGAGNLYYSPPQGGQWVNGNGPNGLLVPPLFCNDGAIIMIDAANITYDANGNVAAFAPNSARLIMEELPVANDPNPFPIWTRQMITNSGAMDRTGNPVTSTFNNMTGLDLDPNGGTFTPGFPDPLGNFNPVPNFVFCSDPGAYGGTIWSTAGNGTVATINGVLCGSTTLGVLADGSWLGVQLDVANFQPTLMGLQVVGQIPYEPFVLDMPKFGAIEVNAIQPTIDIDAHFVTPALVIVLAGFNMPPVGGFPPSVDTALLPLQLGPFNHFQTFPIFAPENLGVNITDAFGYTTISLGNPYIGQWLGIPMIVQAGAIDINGDITVSNPVMAQFK